MIDNKQLPDLLETVKGYGKMRKRPTTRLSKTMGMASNYLSLKLKNPNAEILLLLELSELLNVNLVEHYILLLPPALQTTHRERALIIENEDLKKELKRVGEERDKYWEVVAGKK